MTAGSATVTVRNPDGQTANSQTFAIGPAQNPGTVRMFITAPTVSNPDLSGDPPPTQR